MTAARTRCEQGLTVDKFNTIDMSHHHIHMGIKLTAYGDKLFISERNSATGGWIQ